MNISVLLSLYYKPPPFFLKDALESIYVNQYIYRFVNLIKGNFVPYFHKDTFVIPLVSYNAYMKTRKRFFCLNDTPKVSNEDYIKTKTQLVKDLTEILS